MPRTFTYPKRIIPARSVMGYTLDELREYQPAAYARIFHEWQDIPDYDCCEDSAYDIRAAYDGLLDTMGVSDYRRGEIAPSYHRPSAPWFTYGDMSDADTFTGARAMAWIENHLLTPLRREWVPITKRVRRWDNYNGGRATLAYSWRDSGRVDEYAMTGMYVDAELIAAVVDSVRSGATVDAALTAMWSRACELLEQEHEYHTSEQYFREIHDGYYYDHEGDMITNMGTPGRHD